jgi:hypothetical protein
VPACSPVVRVAQPLVRPIMQPSLQRLSSSSAALNLHDGAPHAEMCPRPQSASTTARRTTTSISPPPTTSTALPESTPSSSGHRFMEAAAVLLRQAKEQSWRRRGSRSGRRRPSGVWKRRGQLEMSPANSRASSPPSPRSSLVEISPANARVRNRCVCSSSLCRHPSFSTDARDTIEETTLPLHDHVLHSPPLNHEFIVVHNLPSSKTTDFVGTPSTGSSIPTPPLNPTPSSSSICPMPCVCTRSTVSSASTTPSPSRRPPMAIPPTASRPRTSLQASPPDSTYPREWIPRRSSPLLCSSTTVHSWSTTPPSRCTTSTSHLSMSRCPLAADRAPSLAMLPPDWPPLCLLNDSCILSGEDW